MLIACLMCWIRIGLVGFRSRILVRLCMILLPIGTAPSCVLLPLFRYIQGLRFRQRQPSIQTIVHPTNRRQLAIRLPNPGLKMRRHPIREANNPRPVILVYVKDPKPQRPVHKTVHKIGPTWHRRTFFVIVIVRVISGNEGVYIEFWV